jgi:hypothetical protein
MASRRGRLVHPSEPQSPATTASPASIVGELGQTLLGRIGTRKPPWSPIWHISMAGDRPLGNSRKGTGIEISAAFGSPLGVYRRLLLPLMMRFAFIGIPRPGQLKARGRAVGELEPRCLWAVVGVGAGAMPRWPLLRLGGLVTVPAAEEIWASEAPGRRLLLGRCSYISR